MIQESRWQAQFYPGTQTRRNLLNIQDADQLRRVEYQAVAERTRELLDLPDLIVRTFDTDHFQAIHQHLFQDIYPWAGKFREFNMSKLGGQGFAFQPDGIFEYLGRAFDVVAEVEWESLDEEHFPRAIAWLYAELNHAHPFPEGNGRAGKIFLEHVASQSRFRLDFSRVDSAAWNIASEMSMPGHPTWDPDPVPLVTVFETATELRNPVQALARQQAVLLRKLPSVETMTPSEAQTWVVDATSSMRALGRLDPATRELPELTETARRISGVEARTIAERAWPFDSYQRFVAFDELYGSFTRAVNVITYPERNRELPRRHESNRNIHHEDRDPISLEQEPKLQY